MLKLNGKDNRLEVIIFHRLASAYSFAGNYNEAILWSYKVIKNFNKKYSGSFAARCLDTHARILSYHNLNDDAIRFNDESIRIKKNIRGSEKIADKPYF